MIGARVRCRSFLFRGASVDLLKMVVMGRDRAAYRGSHQCSNPDPIIQLRERPCTEEVPRAH